MMEVGSAWYNRIATEIGQYQVTLGEKGFKKYKLDLLMRIARRVDDFSNTCGECQTFKQEITSLVQEMGLLLQMPSKEGFKKHTRSVNRVLEHLKKVHKLVEKGHYLGMGIGIGMAVGAALGSAIGAALDQPGVGSGVGIALGVAVGLYLDRKAKEEGRVL
jgi:hypothetical protein